MLPKSLQNLIDELKKLPGIGPKSAERLAFHLLRTHRGNLQKLSESILKLSDGVKICAECFNLSEKNPCKICSDPHREKNLICVVEETTDALAIERTHEYKGLYHILHGKISPLNKIGPADLKIQELIGRVKRNGHQEMEIILALNSDIESEMTALYIGKLLKPFGVKVTRIARGIPVGSDIEFADQITLSSAISGRQEILYE